MHWRTHRWTQSLLEKITLAVLAGLIGWGMPGSAKAQTEPRQPLPKGTPPTESPNPRIESQQLPTPPPGPPPVPSTIPVPPSAAPPGTPCPHDPPTPVVSLKMRVVACSVEGEDIHYQICITNSTPATAYDVTVRDAVPNNAKYVTAIPKPNGVGDELVWKLGTMQGCRSKIIRLVLRPLGTGPVQNCARVSFEHGQCVTTQVAKRVGIIGPGGIGPGGGLRPGQPGANGGPGTPGRPGQKGGKKKGDGKIPEPPKGNGKGKKKDDPRITPEVIIGGEFELRITGKSAAVPGQPLVYTITAKNVGKGPIRFPEVKVTIPEGMEYISSEPEGKYLFPKAPTRELIWNIPTLPVNQTRQFRFTVKGLKRPNTERWKICLEPTAQGGRYDDGTEATRAKAKFCTTFFSKAGLNISADVVSNPLFIGEKTSFSITASNPGSADIEDLKIVATAYPGLVIYAAEGPTKEKITAFPRSNKFEVAFEVLKRLPAGETRTFYLFLRGVQVKNDPKPRRDSKIRVVYNTNQIKNLISDRLITVSTESGTKATNGLPPVARKGRPEPRNGPQPRGARTVRLQGIERVDEPTRSEPFGPLPKMPASLSIADSARKATENGNSGVPRH